MLFLEALFEIKAPQLGVTLPLHRATVATW